jgi:hypothetical protein
MERRVRHKMSGSETESESAPMELEVPDSEEAEDCVICFEAIAIKAVLPCDCKLTYCVGCWDRCLAQSFQRSRRARCPTCRTPVRVDFDANIGQAVFSRMPENLPSSPRSEDSMDVTDTGPSNDVFTRARNAFARLFDDESMVGPDGVWYDGNEGWHGNDGVWYSAAQWAAWEEQALRERRALERDAVQMRQRLLEQTRPAQKALLRKFGGEAAARVSAMAGTGPGLDSTDATKAQMLDAARPPCVCGGVLERVSFEERTRRALQRQVHESLLGTPRFDEELARITALGCACDLCGSDIVNPSMVWACPTGNKTILHTNAYDICDQCFRHHVGLSQTAEDVEQTAAKDYKAMFQAPSACRF